MMHWRNFTRRKGLFLWLESGHCALLKKVYRLLSNEEVWQRQRHRGSDGFMEDASLVRKHFVVLPPPPPPFLDE